MLYHLHRTNLSGTINVMTTAIAQSNPSLLAELILAGLPASVSRALGRYSADENKMPQVSEFQLSEDKTNNPARGRISPEVETYIRAWLDPDLGEEGDPTIHLSVEGIIVASVCDGDVSAIILVPAGSSYVVLTNADAKKDTTWHHQSDQTISCPLY